LRQLRFKVLDDNMTKAAIDPESVAIYPSTRNKVAHVVFIQSPGGRSDSLLASCGVRAFGVQLHVARELVSGDYVIWNSLGHARAAVPAPDAGPVL